MEEVHIMSGNQPRYFTWGLSATPPKTTTAVSVVGDTNLNPNAIPMESPFATFMATVVGTGNVSATVIIEGTNDPLSAQYAANGAAPTNNNWVALGTITIASAASPQTAGFAYQGPWRWVRARVTAVAGTAATITVIEGN